MLTTLPCHMGVEYTPYVTLCMDAFNFTFFVQILMMHDK